MINSEQIRSELAGSPLEHCSESLIEETRLVLLSRRHGDTDKWLDVLDSLPEAYPSIVDLNSGNVTIGQSSDLSVDQLQQLEQCLKSFHPWRKGPFSLFGIEIDAEWRSNLKWARLENAIQPLNSRLVLDVGCGNGYYMCRMVGAGAQFVLGIDPTQLFSAQFRSITKYIPRFPGTVLPLRCEELPFHSLGQNGVWFDTVFSMGVLYHRKKQSEHLAELFSLLRPGGELVLETLVIEGEKKESLVPEKSYSKMPNVSGIPTIPLLMCEVEAAGFEKIKNIDITPTTSEEQRKTEWMTFESLANYLDPQDSTKTIEGYPAPIRTILLATKP